MYQRRFIALIAVAALILFLSSINVNRNVDTKADTFKFSSLNIERIGKSNLERRAKIRDLFLEGTSHKRHKKTNGAYRERIELFFERNKVSVTGVKGHAVAKKDKSGLVKLMSTKNDLVTRLIGKDPDKLSSPYIVSYEDSETCDDGIVSLTKQKRKHKHPKAAAAAAKVILYWQDDYYVSPRHEGFARMCKRVLARPCEMIFDKSQHAKVDAIIFHASRISLMKPPFKKEPGQIWIARGLESPIHWRKGYRNPGWRRVFNWTMTYRPDSEVFAPVGSLFRRPEPPFLDHRKIALGKTRSVAWFVSDCSTDSKREDYVNEMKKYIDVDIYGACGDLVCDKVGPDCTWMLSEKYRFYLAFENSYCPYYVTEKFFTKFGGLESPIYVIPVVRGGFDYRKYFPDATYINADDFRSAKDLADYLNALSDDVDAYAALLERKAHFGYKSCLRGDEWCRVCDLLHDRNRPVNIYRDLGAWWDQLPCPPSPE